MRVAVFLVLVAQLYSCYGQAGDAMVTPPMPNLPPVGQTTKMMAPPSPTQPPVDGSATSSPDTTPAAVTAGPSIAPSEDCLDKRDDCRLFGASGCSGIYTSWAKYNCPRFCGFCVNPNDTKVDCKDNIKNCNEYENEMCTRREFTLFAEDNCRKYCNLCDTKLTGSNAADSGVVNMQPSRNQDADAAPADSTNGTVCQDTVDYCWTEPDENCFGIYEPWAKGHCPYRCFFCPEKPPCEDKLDYCSQFDSNSCSDPSFVNWARLNCRKTCNLCDPPKPPPSVGGGTTISGGQGQGVSGTVTTSGPVVTPGNNPGSVPTTKAPPSGGNNNMNTNITRPSGTVNMGATNIFIIQGSAPLVPGTCYYKGDSHDQDKNWYDGCDYICNCLDAKRNRIICTERCTTWQNTDIKLDGCSWVKESGDCCQRLECSVD